MSRALGSKYTLGESIGKGAMGEAFRGTDHQGNELAFKLLHAELAADTDVVQRFVLERSILLALNGENLVEVHDLVMEGDTLAIVMDLVAGGDLRAAIVERGPFSPSEVCRIGAGIARGLAVVHAAGIVHRDVKPANILLAGPVAAPIPQLTDFGISSLIDVDHVRNTTVVGTPQYIAPEIAAGDHALPASDLYSLGIVLYEMAVGVTPFAGGSVMAVLQRHSTTDAGRPLGIPDGLWQSIRRLLAKNPAQRPETAMDVATALDALVTPLAAFPPAPGLDTPPEPIPVSGTATMVALPAAVDTPATALPAAAQIVPTDEPTRHLVGAAVSGSTAQYPGNSATVPPRVPEAPPSVPESWVPQQEPDLPAGKAAGSRGVLFVVIGLVLAVVLVGAAAYFYLGGFKNGTAIPGPQVENSSPASGPSQNAAGAAPNLRGMTMDQARLALPTDVKLVETRAPEADLPVGQISVQDPAAGEPLGDTLSVGIVHADDEAAAQESAIEEPATEAPTTAPADSDSSFAETAGIPNPSQGSWADLDGAELRGTVHNTVFGAQICADGGPESGHIVYDLAGEYGSFSATVALVNAAEDEGTTAHIEAIVDGNLYDSATISQNSFRDWDIDLTGASTLEFNWTKEYCGSDSAMLGLGSPVFNHS